MSWKLYLQCYCDLFRQWSWWACLSTPLRRRPPPGTSWGTTETSRPWSPSTPPTGIPRRSRSSPTFRLRNAWMTKRNIHVRWIRSFLMRILIRRAVDPDSALQVNPDPIRIQGFDDKNWIRKKYSWKFFFILLCLIKNCNLLIPRPLWRTSKLQEKPPALKRQRPALQKWNLLTF